MAEETQGLLKDLELRLVKLVGEVHECRILAYEISRIIQELDEEVKSTIPEKKGMDMSRLRFLVEPTQR